jgi:hypothetical protein
LVPSRPNTERSLTKEYHILENDAVQSGKILPTFRKNYMASRSRTSDLHSQGPENLKSNTGKKKPPEDGCMEPKHVVEEEQEI